jgi:pimeloyl-ACP methyl ester carboxylesterase
MHVLLLGWGGSRPRQLASYVDIHRRRGSSTRLYINDGLGLLVRPEQVRRRCAEEAARLAEVTDELLVHSFSDNGFITLCTIVAALRESDAGRRALARIRGVILDSGPALWAASPAEFARRYALAATSVLLRRRSARPHPLVTPLLHAGFRAICLLDRTAVQRLQSAYPAVAADYPDCPHLVIRGDGDPLAPAADIDAFASKLAARGIGVRCCPIATDVHVGSFRAAPDDYRAAIDAFLG